MDYAREVVWVLAIIVSIFAGLLIWWVSIVVAGGVPLVGYLRIRRLGYSPPAAATLILGVMGAALLRPGRYRGVSASSGWRVGIIGQGTCLHRRVDFIISVWVRGSGAKAA